VLVLVKELGMGGAERLVVDLALHGDRDRFDTEVAYVLTGHDALAHELVEAGIAVHDLSASGSLDLRWTGRLRTLVATGNFDVVHAHLPYTAALGRLAVRSLPARTRPLLVYTEHSLWDRTALLTRALNRATVGLDAALIVVSRPARDALPEVLRPRARVILHGVDRARSAAVAARGETGRAAVRAELGLDAEQVLAVTVANLREEKGYDTWLGAAAALRDRKVSVTLVSVGWGPLQDAVVSEAQRSGLDGRVRFLGRRSDALELVAGADIFVLPSHHEGMPVALMEAMSLGTPVVATAVGGVPDIVTSGVEGLLVPPRRPELLADAIAELATDPVRRAELGRAARERSAAFDVAVATRAVEAVYDEVLAGRRQ
jgi:glycosyltransferase involved in cell wall biosynthesis